MPKITAPLLSFDASGQIAKTQVYSKWKGRPYVRRYVVPENPNTAGQQLTRNTFAFLNNLWKFLPAGAIGAWTQYADASRFTNRNGWLKQNVGPLRTETDLLNIVLSTAAGSGLIAAGLAVTPGAGSLELALTAPTLPAGWSIVMAHALAVRNVDPQTSDIYDVGSATDNSAPYAPTITGLTASEEYVCGGWFQFLKPNGDSAYGVSLQDVGTPS